MGSAAEQGRAGTGFDIPADGFAPLGWILYFTLSLAASAVAVDAMAAGAGWGLFLLAGSALSAAAGPRLARALHGRAASEAGGEQQARP